MRSHLISILLPLMFLTGCQKHQAIEPEEIVLHLDDEGKFTVDTKATAVTSLPSSLYWGMTYSNGTVKQATTSKSVSSSKISTGYYQTLSPTTYIHYVSNLNFTAGGAMTVADNGTDVIVGKSSSSSATPSVTLNHIFARTGTLTCNTQSGYSISGVSWTITSYGSTTGTAGTYNVSSQSWTARSAALSETAITSSSDFYLIPGEYTLKVSYTLSKDAYSKSFVKSGRVALSAGNVNNVTCTASGGDAQEIQFSVSVNPWTNNTSNIDKESWKPKAVIGVTGNSTIKEGKNVTITITGGVDYNGGSGIVDINGVSHSSPFINGKAKVIIPTGTDGLPVGRYSAKCKYSGNEKYFESDIVVHNFTVSQSGGAPIS